MMKHYEIRKKEKVTARLGKPLPLTSEAQQNKAFILKGGNSSSRYRTKKYQITCGIHSFGATQKELDRLIEEGWIVIVEKTTTSQFIVAGYEAKIGKGFVNIGCNNISFNDILCLATYVQSHENETKFEIPEFLFKKSSGTYLRAIKHKTITVEVVNRFPGFVPEAVIKLNAAGGIRKNSPTYGDTYFSSSQVKSLIKNGWLKKKDETAGEPLLRFSDQEVYINKKNEVHLGSHKVPTFLILAIAAEIIANMPKSPPRHKAKESKLLARKVEGNIKRTKFSIELINKLQALGFNAKGLKTTTETFPKK